MPSRKTDISFKPFVQKFKMKISPWMESIKKKVLQFWCIVLIPPLQILLYEILWFIFFFNFNSVHIGFLRNFYRPLYVFHFIAKKLCRNIGICYRVTKSTMFCWVTIILNKWRNSLNKKSKTCTRNRKNTCHIQLCILHT